MSRSVSVIGTAVLSTAALLTAACRPPLPPAPPQQARAAEAPPAPAAPSPRRVIVFVWDGLRPDSIDPAITPELAKLRDERGVNFKNHHSVYPTFTMMNAAAFATGTRSGQHGFYGNFEYQPGPTGVNAKGTPFDYTQPFFTEDHAVLQTLNAYYKGQGGALLKVESLFQVAHRAGLKTATIGKTGPAFLQDYEQDGTPNDQGVVLDENVALPRSFALGLQSAGLPLPKHTINQHYADGPLELAADNGDPTATTSHGPVTLADGVTSDPRTTDHSPHNGRNAYMMRVFTEYVLPKLDPPLSMIWLRNPDSTQHSYGPGTPIVIDALRHQDQLLSALLQTLDKLGRRDSTDLIIASDHGHSSVGADPKVFPQRALTGTPDGHAKPGDVAADGYIVSGDVRSAEWLRRAGFAHVYDGNGCVFDPVLAGIDARGKVLHPSRVVPECADAPSSSKHGAPAAVAEYASTGSFGVPHEPLAKDAIIIAANGGSEYFYVPSQDRQLVQKLVVALQERKPYGPLFVRGLYGELPGTLSLGRIGMEDAQSASPPTPDVVVSFDWDDKATSAAGPSAPGTELASPQGNRGTHGSFSPIDVHNTLIATGPGFRAGFGDELPSSTLDVAPTVAKLLGLSLPRAEGRVLSEALAASAGPAPALQLEPFEQQVGPVPLRRVCELDDPDCKRPLLGRGYAFTLRGQTLRTADGQHSYVYLDQAKVSREPYRSR
ncbi:MAG: alkaline phosphatase family protein [Polyangiales bacterium]